MFKKSFDVMAPNNALVNQFLHAVHTQKPVNGLTHNYYRYPARFSPQFARGAIEAFSRPGDVVLDPFMGGATTLVEARAAGRHAIGSDINSLSVFLGRVKTTVLNDDELDEVIEWTCELPEHLNLHQAPIRDTPWIEAGYQTNLPWPMRKTIEFALARIRELPRKRQHRFVRCMLLKLGQWALDCREYIPSAAEVRRELFECLDLFVSGMKKYRQTLKELGRAQARTLSLQCSAAALPTRQGAFKSVLKRPSLVVTSPPYPGVYVLYHRWKVRGRKESPAPFWVADCLDGQGQAHYCFGDRRQKALNAYFGGIRDSYKAIRQVVDHGALVIQIVAFSEPDWQIPRFLESMHDAGFDEISPAALGIPVDSRMWRSVPGRRWFALIQESLATSKELVLFHRARPA